MIKYTHNHFTAVWILSRTNWVSWHQKGKSSLDLLEQEIVSGSGINLAICTLTQTHNHASIQALILLGRMPFLSSNQQCQSTEGTHTHIRLTAFFPGQAG